MLSFVLPFLTLQAQLDLGDALTLGIGQDSVRDIYDTPASLVNILVPFAFIAAGLIIFIMIIYSGFLYIQDTAKGKEEATKIWTTSAIGLFIMFAAYWIIQIIEVIIGQSVF